MSRKPKRKPTDPAIIAERAAHERAAKRQAERDPAAWGIDTGAMTLPQNTDVAPAKQGKLSAIRRFDLFDRLHERNAISLIALEAVKSMERDLKTRAGEGDRDSFGGQSSSGSRDLVNIYSMAAGDRLTKRREHMGDRPFYLLQELICPRNVTADHPNRWRYVVEIMVGLRDDEAQRRAVVKACDLLAEADRMVGMGRAA